MKVTTAVRGVGSEGVLQMKIPASLVRAAKYNPNSAEALCINTLLDEGKCNKINYTITYTEEV